MKKIIVGGVGILFFVGMFFCYPSLGLASSECFVDENNGSGGDGSKGDPYNKISKAIEEGCEMINVQAGTYDEAFTLKKGVELEGSSQDKVTITKKMTMNNDSKITKVTLNGGGIDVAKNADVEIDSVKIKNAKTGINTTGGGRIVVNKTIITSSGKGMYLQDGANVKITNCKIYGNAEEGLDIRANVDGSIGKNEIHNNKEGGIEVILGKSELLIYDNEIKKNSASGIAAQFYNDYSSIGKVNIKNNIISDNGNFGVDCKVPSGGSKKPAGYWSDSMSLSANKIFENKKGSFSSDCKFEDEKMEDATKTKEQKEAERLTLEKKEQNKTISAEEQKKLEILAKEKAEEERIAREEQEARMTVAAISEEVDVLFEASRILTDKISSRSSFVTFLIGPDYNEIKKMNDELFLYDEKISAAEDKKMVILSESGLIEANERISLMREKKNELNNFIEVQSDKFSVLGWLFKII